MSWFEYIANFGPLVSAAAFGGLIVQFRQNKNQAKGTFLSSLYDSFLNHNQDITDMIIELNYLKEKKDLKSQNKIKSLEEGLKAKISEIVKFLTFFEVLYGLIKSKVIGFNEINGIFGYFFFFSVHNEIIQDRELLPQISHYTEIYCLHKEWIQYREDGEDDLGSAGEGRSLKYIANERFKEGRIKKSYDEMVKDVKNVRFKPYRWPCSFFNRGKLKRSDFSRKNPKVNSQKEK